MNVPDEKRAFRDIRQLEEQLENRLAETTRKAERTVADARHRAKRMIAEKEKELDDLARPHDGEDRRRTTPDRKTDEEPAIDRRETTTLADKLLKLIIQN